MTNYARKKHLFLENEVLSNADKIIVVGEGMRKDFLSLGYESEVITNGYDEDDFTGVVEKDPIFTIVHTGNLLNKAHVNSLWQAITELKEEGVMSNFEINLIGQVGAEKLAELSNFPLKEHLNISGYIPHNEINKRQQAASVLILPLEFSTPVLTGKFFEYLGSASPILAMGSEVSNFEIKEILEKVAHSIFVNYDDKMGIKNYLKLKYNDFEKQSHYTNPPFVSQYSRKNLTKKLSNLLNQIHKK